MNGCGIETFYTGLNLSLYLLDQAADKVVPGRNIRRLFLLQFLKRVEKLPRSKTLTDYLAHRTGSILFKGEACCTSQCGVDLSQLLTEGEKVLSRELFLWVLEGLDKRNHFETGLLNVWEIDCGSRSSEIRHSSRNRPNQLGMSLRHWILLQLIERDMNILEPFMCLLDEQFDQLFLKIV